MSTIEQEFKQAKARQDSGEGIIIVWFSHDMSDSWYEARFPNPSLDGSYVLSSSIQKIAIEKGWAKVWIGTKHYNPWKDGS